MRRVGPHIAELLTALMTDHPEYRSMDPPPKAKNQANGSDVRFADVVGGSAANLPRLRASQVDALDLAAESQ